MTTEYYGNRAPEYDKIYRTPEWQDDLTTLRAWIEECTRGRTVLEVAAGTGYWTKAAAAGAKSITATDYNAAMLAYAAKRSLGAHVVLREADAYALPEFASPFDIGMAHLWWSHVERERRRDFLVRFASRLHQGATLLMSDQVYLKGCSPPAFRRDRLGNRYELRTLENGDLYQIVKNYPTVEELRQSLACICDEIDVIFLRYFWTLRATLRAP
jgi:SAM-dependent methyltransferase